MHWDRVRIFEAVAAYGSVTEASAELGISGSAVSQQLRKLERELGQALVEPSGRGIRLTAAGSLMARHARAVDRQFRQAGDELSRLSGDIGGRLRIGGVMSAMRTLLGPATARLVIEHPKVEPVIMDGEASEFVELLATRQLDVAIIEAWTSNTFPQLSSLNSRPILDEPIDLAVPADLPLRPRTIAEAADLDLPWVVCPPGSGAYQTVTDVLRQAGREPEIRYRISSYPSQLDLVASGLAIALIPRLARESAEQRDVILLSLESPLRRQLHLMTRLGDDRPIVAEFSANLMRQRDLIAGDE